MIIPPPGAALLPLIKLISLALVTPFALFNAAVWLVTAAVSVARHKFSKMVGRSS